MKFNHLTLAAFSLLLHTTTLPAQQMQGKKNGFLSFQASMSDYQTPGNIKNNNFNRNDWLQPGNKSFGLGLQYWKSLGSKVDFSTGLTGTFSNFPAHFVSGDTIGQARFTPQLDALLHLRMLRDKAAINPFLTAGFGAGFFSDKLAVYAPLGAGFQIRFSDGAVLFLQAQWRKKLNDGITNDYLHYSLGFAQSSGRRKKPATDNLPQETIPIMQDKDKDGFADDKDLCPDEYGTLQGCPDTDVDGVPDKQDRCATEKGTLNGCPDKDGDGVADMDDQCPDKAGVARYKGCPVPDSDGDGIDDELDKCPQLAGDADNEGCPAVKQATQEKVSLAARKIYFHFASAEIMRSSYKVLDEVVDILQKDTLLKLTIEAHADNRGLPERNLMWSQRRAKAVADYFIQKGIDASRLTYQGYGDTRPVADNRTEEGRSLNRRVEMKLSYN